MSLTHFWLGCSTLKSCASRLGVTGSACFEPRVFGLLEPLFLAGLADDGSVSWTGVLVVAIGFPIIAVPLLFDVEMLHEVLDLTAVPLGIIYVAAKLGCHRIGCCNWNRNRWCGTSLPLVEAWITLALSAALITLSPAPAGLGFATFLLFHSAAWQAAKRLRA